jgi:hypothetical protein
VTHSNRLGRVVLTILTLWPISAVAQEPACPSASTTTYTGSLTSGGTDTIAVNLQPCEEVSFVVSTTGDPTYGALMGFTAYSSETTPEQLFASSWVSLGTVEQDLPSTPPWFTT